MNGYTMNEYWTAYGILVAAAVIPAIILLVRVYRADRLEKEPAGLLLSLVLLGILSTLLAALAEQLGDVAVSWFFPDGTLEYNLLMFFVVVAVSEEGFKYLLLKKRTWNSPHFNCQFDGLVYAVFVSLGFALWENISYVLQYGLGAAAARALTAVPGHACFGVFMGSWYGAAKRLEAEGAPEESLRARRMALLIPVLLHGAYDFIAVRMEVTFSASFLVFVALLFFFSLRKVRSASRNDRYIASPYADAREEYEAYDPYPEEYEDGEEEEAEDYYS